MDNLIDIETAARKLNTPVGTLRFWRHKGIGPKSAKLGRRIVYRERDLDAWVDEQFAAGNTDQPA